MRLLPPLQSSSDALLHLDFLRFVAAGAIVLLHFSRFLSPGTAALIGPLGGLTLFVDLFFAVSGFVIAYVYSGRIRGLGDYGVFLQRRVARLGPLHWATLFVFLLIGAVVWSGAMPSDHAEIYDPRCLLPNALALHGWGVCRALSFNDVSWSISAEMGMYLAAPLLLAMAARWPGLLLAAACGAMLLLSLAPDQPWLGWTYGFGVARAFPSFAIGVLFHHWREPIARLRWARGGALLLMAAILFGVHRQWALLALLPLVYALVACTIACDLGGRYRPLRIGVLGQLSYSIYMLHPLVRTFGLSFVGQRLFALEGLAADGAVLVGCAATIGIAWLSFTWFETPARRWIAALGSNQARRKAGMSMPSASTLSTSSSPR